MPKHNNILIQLTRIADALQKIAAGNESRPKDNASADPSLTSFFKVAEERTDSKDVKHALGQILIFTLEEVALNVVEFRNAVTPASFRHLYRQAERVSVDTYEFVEDSDIDTAIDLLKKVGLWGQSE